VEQPYAKWDSKRRPRHRPVPPAGVAPLLDRDPRWTTLAAERQDRRAKYAAGVAYASQLPQFGRMQSPLLGRLLLRRVALYESLRGGEATGWID
jgi:hypothetical protein